MEFLGMSRKKLQPGDIFVYKNKYKGYGWGRVINTDVKLLDYEGKISMRGFLLIYIYNVFTDNIKNIPELKKGNLLVPPDIINRRGWLDGYFKTVFNKSLTVGDVLRQHCFKDKVGDNLRYYDDNGNRLTKEIEPCAWYGVGNHRGLDDKISIALGIPLAPVDGHEKEQIPKAWKNNPDIKFGKLSTN